MRVLVASWLGSTNLGDELVFAGLLAHLRELGAEVTAISVDVAGTEAQHGVRAVRDRDLLGVLRAARSADLVVFGGGGLLQDQSSHLNLPYHLSRVAISRSVGTPIVAIGLGVGPLRTRAARSMVRHSLRQQHGRPVRVTVRDEGSRSLLAEVGVASEVTADLAWAMRVVGRPEVRDVLGVCLRPWPVTSRLPAADAWRQGIDPSFLAAVAGHLDRVVDEADVDVEFVAMQAGRDEVVHEVVLGQMRHADRARCVDLDLAGTIASLGSCRAVLSMRYHGGVMAGLGGRPSVLVDYSPKVAALGHDLGATAVINRDNLDDLGGALRAALEVPRQAVVDRVSQLRAREAGNLATLRAALEDD